MLFFSISELYYLLIVFFPNQKQKGFYFMKNKFFYTLFLTGIVFIQVSAQAPRRGTAYYEEMVGRLSNQMRLLQDENATLAGTVHALQQEVRQLKQMMQAYREETTQLRRMISEESVARQKQMGGIADKIQRAADAQAKADAEARAAEAARAAQAQAPVISGEEYDYYVVESGDTLSAVSRAAGVSVARLKKVNGLKSDMLRVGQKLKIPRK